MGFFSQNGKDGLVHCLTWAQISGVLYKFLSAVHRHAQSSESPFVNASLLIITRFGNSAMEAVLKKR